MSDDIVIRAEALGKKYVIGHQAERDGHVTLRDAIARKAKGFASFVRAGGASAGRMIEEFWALKDLSFEIRRGEIIGIIGRNGAGKSTLLKVLSRITEPSEGRVTIQGRVASLLEVGTGFHPELTGRENIFLNGAVMGMTRAEIRGKFDEIVAFAEVERFLDTPVKRYSSGMYVRLAFAVAAHLQSDILIVDEVLAVGDTAFQKRCLGRMGDVSASGRTVLFVSHNIGSLLAVCQTGLLLETGKLSARGEIRSVAKAYNGTDAASSKLSPGAFQGPLRDLHFELIELNGCQISAQAFATPTEDLVFRICGICTRSVPNVLFALSFSIEGVRLLTVHNGPESLNQGPFVMTVKVPRLLLRPGDYMISIGGYRVDGEEWVSASDIAILTITDEWDRNHYPRDAGIINLSSSLFHEANSGLQGRRGIAEFACPTL